MIHEIRVGVRKGQVDTAGQGVLNEAKKTLGLAGLTDVKTTRVYRLEGVTEDEAQRLATSLLSEDIDQTFALNGKSPQDSPYKVEVAYKPGVMNPEVGSILKAANDLGISPLAADSSTEYAFHGEIGEAEVQNVVDRLLVNKTVQRVVFEKPKTLVIDEQPGPVQTVPIIDAGPDELMQLSNDKLFLSLEEMRVIQRHFERTGSDPTDVELEIIAARWSEHCGHKTFKAKVFVDGVEKQPLYTRIKDTARKYFGDLVISAFTDNAGAMRFYEGQAICAKVETHNSPSAAEPYGGAATGSGGVFRDIAGTGQGAKNIASTDMFSFARPDLPPSELPSGTLRPDYLQRRVVAGVRDYGNRMGIPTNNGSLHFHDDFKAKPTVIVGAYGILPENRAQKGKAEVNDLVVVVGGRTGRDGIHGATFSSGEMTERTATVNASAVQIGNAIEEKRMFDALLEARDRDLIRAITDCGAAGFSSAIGEMGEETGVTVDISKAPLKYQGLAPWEIFLSESQERMVIAVDPLKIEEFLRVCRKFNVEATVLGKFDGLNRLTVKYGDETVADLDYEFLKNGFPQREMKARYQPALSDKREPSFPTDWAGTLKRVLSHGNVCSKEQIVRQYDHGVQGTNSLPPFGGAKGDGPNDAVVLTPILGKPYGMVISHGMNPILNRIDPYWGSVWAIAEAMANYVAVGGNPDESAWVNNYIWPFPDEEAMGSLDRCVDAVVDCMNALGRPVISGKDSLSSTYRGKDGTVIKIPPTLCMSVFGRIPDVEKTVSSDFKKDGSTIVLVGKMDVNAMGGSTYYDINGILGDEVPKVDLKLLPKVLGKVYQAIQKGQVLASHDVSEGGVIGAVCEMVFGGDCGAVLSYDASSKIDKYLFNETAGCFVVEVEDEKKAEEFFKGVPYEILGKTQKDKKVEVLVDGLEILSTPTDELKKAWQEPERKIFG